MECHDHTPCEPGERPRNAAAGEPEALAAPLPGSKRWTPSGCLVGGMGSATPAWDGRRRRLTRAFRRRAVPLLGAALAMFLFRGGAHAQTSQVLVSNLGQTYQTATGFSSAGAQGFSTGTNAAGYTLTSVEIRLAAQQVPTVTLHRGSPAGTKVADFTGPSSAAGRADFVDYTFTPTTTVTLDRNTDYWVVATDSAFGDLWAVAGPGEDATPAPGWSIRDRGQVYNPNRGSWQDHGADLANQVRLSGVIESDPTPPDTTAPTVAITTTAEEPVSGPFPITVTFSETVTGFDLDDLVVGNGSASNLAGSGRSHTATVTPAASGTVTVDIPAGAAEDDANNPSTAAARLSVNADLTPPDTTPPTVEIATTAEEPVSGPFPVTVTFSETVTGFDLDDLVVGNGSASNLAGGGASYTANVTPAASGTVTVDIPPGAAEDGANNPSTAAARLSVNADLTPPDTTPPTVEIATTAEEPVSGPFPVTVTFSETVTGFDLDDLVVGNGSASNLAGGGASYTANVTPAASGTVTVDIPPGAAEDGANNPSTAAARLSVNADLTPPDTTPPTVEIATTAEEPVSGPFPVTVTFSETVTGFDLDDLVVGNGSASNLAGGGASYTANVTPAASGTVTVDIPPGAAEDGANNPSTAAARLSVNADLTPPDTTPPTVEIATTAEEPVSGPFPVTVTFSETVTGFDLDDLVVGNGSASNLAGGGASYTANVTPAASGTVTVDIPPGAAEDGAGNPSTAVTRLSVTADLTPPTVEITTTAEQPVTGPFPITVTFSETVTGFDLDDLVVGNGSASNLAGSGRSHTATVTPAASGTVTVDIPAGAAEDDANNPSTAAARLSVNADLTPPDTTPPTVEIATTAEEPVSGPFPVTVTFSETVTGFDLDDLVVGNGSASNLAGGGASYTANVTPAASGTVTVDIPPGAAEDGANNPSTAAARLSVNADLTPPDTTPPTVEIATTAEEPVSGPFPITVTFSETVTGFDLDDLVVGNGSASNLAGSGASYTATVTAAASGAVTVDIPAGAAEDDAGNPSTAAVRLSVTADLTPPDTTPPTVEITTTAKEPVTGPFPVAVTFSETVTGFDLDDLVVGNGSASNLAGSGGSYTVTVTPAASGEVTVDIPPGAAEDDAGNPSTAVTRLSVAADLTEAPARPEQPTVTPGDRTLTLSWAPVPGASSYTVAWKSGAEQYSAERQTIVETTSALLEHLTNGTEYTVRVRASNTGGDSDWSEEATGTPMQPVPSLPAAAAGLLGLLLALLGGRRRPGGGVDPLAGDGGTLPAGN